MDLHNNGENMVSLRRDGFLSTETTMSLYYVVPQLICIRW